MGGLMTLSIWNNIYDYGFWPLIQGMFGMYGIIGLIVLTFILNFGVLWFYRTHCNTDWLGFELSNDIVRKSQELQVTYRESTGRMRPVLAIGSGVLLVAERVLEGKWIPFILLSIFQDSFMAVAFHLHGKKYSDGKMMHKGDYLLFILSTLIGCGAWTVLTEFVTLPVFTHLWKKIV
jgi:hypothetical protein